MKKFVTTALLLVILAAFPGARAQQTELDAGIARYEEGEYREALGYFTKAIENERKLDGYDLSRSYYYRALTWLRLFNELVNSGNPGVLDASEQLLLNAYDDLKTTSGLDDTDIAFRAHNQLNDIQYQLTQEGLRWLNHATDLKTGGRSYMKEAGIAVRFFRAATDIAGTYLALDLLGQALMLVGDNEEALSCLGKSEGAYQRQLPEDPDFMMGYVFYRQALIHKEIAHEPHLAIQDIERGIELMNSENQRLGMLSGKLGEKEFKHYFGQYEQVRSDLNEYRLDIYLESKELFYEAIRVFEEELEESPGDVDLLIGFASLLERSDRDRAIGLYLDAIRLDPGNEVAAFNVGAMYYNKAKDFFDAADGETDNDKYSLLFEKALENFELARPYFEQILSKDGSSLNAIIALKTIAMIFDDQESYERYKRMESELGQQKQ